MTLILVLRLVHIFSAIFWVGGALLMTFFVAPSVRATAEAGQKFLAYLVTQARITRAISISAMLTVAAGIWLYWIDSIGFSSAWVQSSAGIGFGIGGFAGILALIVGSIFGKNIGALGTIFANIQGKPTSEQIVQLQGIQKRLGIIGPIHIVVQIIAIICMATARYWRF